MTPLLLMSLFVMFGVYVLGYVIVSKGLHQEFSLPVVVVRHYLLLERFVKAYVFDSFPSGESLI